MDYVLCSKSAVPFAVSVTPVLAAPWKPHIGLEVTLRSSGEQLITRVLGVPGRLPQVPCPASGPTVGSKSSLAKLERQVQHHIAVDKRAQKFASLFGDCGPQTSCAHPEGEGSGDQDTTPPESREHVVESDYPEWPEEGEDPWAEESSFVPESSLGQPSFGNSFNSESVKSGAWESGRDPSGVAEGVG
eukprot:6928517-Pyramimonas_sp.AAC.1